MNKNLDNKVLERKVRGWKNVIENSSFIMGLWTKVRSILLIIVLFFILIGFMIWGIVKSQGYQSIVTFSIFLSFFSIFNIFLIYYSVICLILIIAVRKKPDNYEKGLKIWIKYLFKAEPNYSFER